MAQLIITSGELLAEEDERTVSGLLVPFGEQCRSNLGRFTIDRGVLTAPADVPGTIAINDGHARNKPLGRGVLLAEQADGWHGTFAFARTPEGDQALADAKSGKRNRLSVEADIEVVNGKAVRGNIFGAALVTEGKRGAFPSAMLLATEADDVDDPEDPTVEHYSNLYKDPVSGETVETDTTVEEEDEVDQETGATVTTRTTTTITTTTPGTPAEGTDPVTGQTTAPVVPAAPDDQLLAERPAARVPSTLLGRQRQTRRPVAEPTVNLRQLYAMLAAAAPTHSKGSWNPERAARLMGRNVVGTLYAELEDITFDAAGSPNDMIVPQWIGELWAGRAYQRRWIPLFNSGTLTSDTVKGWRWKVRPEVGKYSGNKTPVPTGPIETEPYDVEAQPFAGAHDIDRRYRDFNVTEFWDGYFTAMTESYAKQSDLYVPEQLFDDANAALTKVTAGTVPAGVSPVMVKIVDGALAVLDEDLPSFAAVTMADYRDLLLTRADDNLAFLNAALGLEEGSIENFRVVPTNHPALASDNSALVGCKSAATVHELGGSPIRVEGLDVAKGGIDPGLFGYTAIAVHNPKALARIKPKS